MNHRSLTRWFTAFVAGGVVLAAVLVLRDARALEAHLGEVEAHLTEVRAALQDVDQPRATAQADQAMAASRAARERIDGPLWWVLEHLPVTGDLADLARAAVDVAGLSARSAEAVAQDAETLLDDAGQLDVRVDRGRVDLEVFTDAARVLQQVPVDDLEAAIERLEAPTPRFLPAGLAERRRSAVATARETLADLSLARDVVEHLPGFLGGDGPRSYLLALQNPAELRATGGFLGFVGVLHAQDGRLRLGESDDVDPLGSEVAGPEDASWRRNLLTFSRGNQPAPASDDYAQRYDGTAARQWLGNVNVHPDVPTIAPMMLDIWRQETGEQLHGVILASPQMLVRVLEAMGSDLDVPDRVSDPRLPDPIAPEDLLQTLLKDVYDVFGGTSSERKAFHRAAATAAFAQVFAGGWEPRPMIDALGASVGGQDLSLFSADAEEQGLWTRLGATGAFGPDGSGAFMGVTINNQAANKADVHMSHAVDVDLEVVELHPGRSMARVQATVGMELRNDLADPLAHDEYVWQSYFPQEIGDAREQDDRIGMNRSWFTLWAPPGAIPVAATVDGVEATTPWPWRIGDLVGMDFYLEAAPLSVSRAEVTFLAWVPLQDTAAGPTLVLDWHPPATASPFVGEVRVRVPADWEASGDDTAVLGSDPDTLTLLTFRRTSDLPDPGT